MSEQLFTAYAAIPEPPKIQRANLAREWMSAANENFPYRCLPLTMANQLGWDLINPMTFTAVWNGGPNHHDIKIQTPTNQQHPLVQTHFGVATLTFSLGYLFRTPPGIGLLITGAPNQPLDGLQPCTGYVETEWLPATSTMNWLFTRANHTVIFPVGMPMCRVIPYPRGLVEQMTPQIRHLSDNPELHEQFTQWSIRRDQFNKQLHDPNSDSAKRKWQKDYFLGGGRLAKEGVWPDRSDIHQTKFSHLDFEDMRDNPAYLNDRYKDDFRPFALFGAGKATTIWVKHQLKGQADDEQTGNNSNHVGMGGTGSDSPAEDHGSVVSDPTTDGVRADLSEGTGGNGRSTTADENDYCGGDAPEART